MNLGILADSHDHLTHLQRAAEFLSGRSLDFLVHAGDFVAPFALPSLFAVGCPVKAVFGNNDGEKVGLTTRFAQAGGSNEVHERPWVFWLGDKKVLVLVEILDLA